MAELVQLNKQSSNEKVANFTKPNQIRLEVEGQEGVQYWVEDCSAQGIMFIYSYI